MSSCGKGRQWPLALELLAKIQGQGLEQDAITYSAVVSSCENWVPMAAGIGASGRDAGSRIGAKRHLLQRCHERMQERVAMTAGAGASGRDAGSGIGSKQHHAQRCHKGTEVFCRDAG